MKHPSLLLSGLMVLMTAPTLAQVGLDATFGTGGITTSPIGADVDWAKAIALQPDGKILLGGFAGSHMALARYTAEGQLDAGFGSQGKVITVFPGSPSDIRAIAVQPDGRILAAGLVTISNPTGSPGYFAVLRYLSDGSPDPSFGTNGRVTTLIGTSCIPYAMALLPDGRILVAGNDDQGFAVARYLADGTLVPPSA